VVRSVHSVFKRVWQGEQKEMRGAGMRWWSVGIALLSIELLVWKKSLFRKFQGQWGKEKMHVVRESTRVWIVSSL
jgi:hypothetical protein